MNFVRKSFFALLLPILVIVTAVYAVDTVTLSPSSVIVSPGDTIVVTSVLSGATGTSSYARSIDGTPVATQTGATLTLDWGTYVGLFPTDATQAATRVVSLTVTDSSNSESGSASLVIEQVMIVSPVTPVTSSNRIFGGDNYCGDGIIKIDLGEECDDGNGKNGDGCSINCVCEKGYNCLPNGLNIEVIPETDERHSSNNQSNPDENTGSNNNEDDNSNDDLPLKDMMKERNRTPLDLGAGTSTMAPLETPSSGADWRLIGVYAETQSTIDISTTLPKRAAGHVAKPIVLPMTGSGDTGRPSRVTLS